MHHEHNRGKKSGLLGKKNPTTFYNQLPWEVPQTGFSADSRWVTKPNPYTSPNLRNSKKRPPRSFFGLVICYCVGRLKPSFQKKKITFCFLDLGFQRIPAYSYSVWKNSHSVLWGGAGGGRQFTHSFSCLLPNKLQVSPLPA